MKQLTLTVILFISCFIVQAQTTIDFEDITLSPESFLNGSEGSGGYTSGNIFFPNFYNDAWGAWQGWAISNTTDVSTPGPDNQYSAITGSGYEASSNYAVSFISGSTKMNLENLSENEVVDGFYLTNGTYPYLSMLEGDGFAKKFGGTTGNDPDFFFLTIKKYLDGVLSTDSVDFYLADFRFSDNSSDYIVDEWTYLDLTSLGKADSLVFYLHSSDANQFGINTPGYFCIDNIITSGGTIPVNNIKEEQSIELFPNPTSDLINLKNSTPIETRYALYDIFGKQILSQEYYSNQTQIDIGNLATGTYILEIQNESVNERRIVIKQ